MTKRKRKVHKGPIYRPETNELRCPTCELWKPMTKEFWPPSKRAKRGFFNYCKVCNNRRHKAWRKKNPDKMKAYKKSEGYKKAQRKYKLSEKSRERDREYKRRLREKNGSKPRTEPEKKRHAVYSRLRRLRERLKDRGEWRQVQEQARELLELGEYRGVAHDSPEPPHSPDAEQFASYEVQKRAAAIRRGQELVVERGPIVDPQESVKNRNEILRKLKAGDFEYVRRKD